MTAEKAPLPKFNELGLSDKVLQAITAAGYETPTPIQAGAIPHALAGKDILGIAQTGTGKTASFVLPMITRLERGRARARMPRTLIVEPTRELAAQVYENFEKYGVNHKLNVALLIGGVSFEDQERKLERGADVLIATPGRLLDHFDRGKLLLTGVDILVIDEADRMLDMGFIPDIERIVSLIPFTRQTLFFSATMPKEIQRLADQFLQAPERVEVARASSAAKTVEQKIMMVRDKDYEKRDALRKLIREQDDLKNGIIFCNRKRDVSNLYKSLEKHGFSVGALHGDMDQRSRMMMLDAFKNNRIQLLVASDVAARGLDIPDVSHVFNFDVPIHAEDYVHRIGRTGRAGRSGKAFSLVERSMRKYLDSIEEMLKTKLDVMPQADDEQIEISSSETPAPEEKSAKSNRRKRIKEDNQARKSDSTVEASSQATEKPKQKRRRGNGDDFPVPVGFGEEIPAFMMIGR
ncbi:MAG: DEAD/DEAH box helicase [Pseudomonadota bacterium]